MSKTICLDFDGVMNTYDGWKGEDNLFMPKPGLPKFLAELRDRGFDIVVCSTRNVVKILEWLQIHHIDHYIKDVTNIKPLALAYIDDRGFRFSGDYNATLMHIDFGLKTYWEK